MLSITSNQNGGNSREIMHVINLFLQEYNMGLPEDKQKTVDQLIESKLTWYEKVPALRKFSTRDIWNSMKPKEKNGVTIKAFAFKKLYHERGGLKDPFFADKEGNMILSLQVPTADAPAIHNHQGTTRVGPVLPPRVREALTSISFPPSMSSNSSLTQMVFHGNINITNTTTNTTTTTSAVDPDQLAEKVLKAAQIGAERGAKRGCDLTRDQLIDSMRKGAPPSSARLDRSVSQNYLSPAGCKKLFRSSESPEDISSYHDTNFESPPDAVNLPYKTTGLEESPKKKMPYFLSVVSSPPSVCQYRRDSVCVDDSLCSIDQELLLKCFLSVDETLERPGDELDCSLYQVRAWETINEMLQENSFVFPPAIQVSRPGAAVKLLQALLTSHTNPPQDLNNGLFVWLREAEVESVLYFEKNDLTEKEEDTDFEHLRRAFGLHSIWTFELFLENDLEAEISIAMKRGYTGINLFDILINALESLTLKEVVVQSPSSESSLVWGVSDKALKKLLTLRCESIEFAFIRFDAIQCAALGRSKCPVIFRQCDFDDRGDWIVDSAKVNDHSLNLVTIPGFKPLSIGFKERIPTSIQHLKQGMCLEALKDIAFENINWYQIDAYNRDIVELCGTATQSEGSWCIQAPNTFKEAFSGNTNALSFIGCKWIVKKYGITEGFHVPSIAPASGETTGTNMFPVTKAAPSASVTTNAENPFVPAAQAPQNVTFEGNVDVGLASTNVDRTSDVLMASGAEDDKCSSLDLTDHSISTSKSRHSSPPDLKTSSNAEIIVEETMALCDSQPVDGSTSLLPSMVKIPKTHKGEPCRLCMTQYRRSTRYCHKHADANGTDFLYVNLI